MWLGILLTEEGLGAVTAQPAPRCAKTQPMARLGVHMLSGPHAPLLPPAHCPQVDVEAVRRLHKDNLEGVRDAVQSALATVRRAGRGQ